MLFRKIKNLGNLNRIIRLGLCLSLAFNFLFVLNVFAQSSNLSSVRLSVSPLSGVVANRTPVTLRVTGAPPGTQVCFFDEASGGSAQCFQNLTDGSGAAAETFSLGEVGTYRFRVRVGGESGPIAPSAVAGLNVSEYANFMECQTETGDVNGCCVKDKVPLNDACFQALANDLPEGPVITPDTGNRPPVIPEGVGPSNASPNSSWCGNDPNLEYDSAAKICLPKGQKCTEGSLACARSLSDLIIKIVNYLLFFAGMIAVLAIVIGGFWYITAAGNEEQSEKGKKALVSAIIGIVLVSLAYLIVRVITGTLNSANVIG